MIFFLHRGSGEVLTVGKGSLRNPTYHVHALEAQVDGNTGGQTVVHTRTHEQLIGLAKLLAQFARTRDLVKFQGWR